MVATSGHGSGGAWYLAPSLVELMNEVDRLWPGRDTSSDGSIGDASHQARASDHNPDWSAGGVVRAVDITTAGIDFDRLLAAVKADKRAWYVIHEGHIYSRTYGWAKRVYDGPNPHTHHAHVSILRTSAAASSTAPWFTSTPTGQKPTPPPQAQNGELTMADVDAILKAIADLKEYQRVCTIQIQDNVRQNVDRAIKVVTKYNQSMAVATNNYTRQIVQGTDAQSDAERQAEMDAALQKILDQLPAPSSDAPADGITEAQA